MPTMALAQGHAASPHQSSAAAHSGATSTHPCDPMALGRAEREARCALRESFGRRLGVKVSCARRWRRSAARLTPHPATPTDDYPAETTHAPAPRPSWPHSAQCGAVVGVPWDAPVLGWTLRWGGGGRRALRKRAARSMRHSGRNRSRLLRSPNGGGRVHCQRWCRCRRLGDGDLRLRPQRQAVGLLQLQLLRRHWQWLWWRALRHRRRQRRLRRRRLWQRRLRRRRLRRRRLRQRRLRRRRPRCCTSVSRAVLWHP